MSKVCNTCEETKEATQFRGRLNVCKSCRGVENLPAITSKHFKWRVAIQVCKKGHSYVPQNGKCGVCENAKEKKPCHTCGTLMSPHKYKYCSGKCQYQKAKTILVDRECKHCEKQLHVGQDRFCSWQCNADYKSNIARLLKEKVV
jgi:hypothetical protein